MRLSLSFYSSSRNCLVGTRVEPVVYVHNRRLQLRGNAAILIKPFSFFTSFKSELKQYIYICNGVEWSKDRTQAAESIKWRPQQAYGYFNRIKTTFHYCLLVLNKARQVDDGYKRMDLEGHRLLIKLDPASK